jgi:tetratricopeptide (TPR) repeat protein
MPVPPLKQPQELERLVEALWHAPSASHVAFALFDSAVVREYVLREVATSGLPAAVYALLLDPETDLGAQLAELAKVPPAVVFLFRSEVSSERFGPNAFWPRIQSAIGRPELAPHRFIHWVTVAQYRSNGAPRPALLPFGVYNFQLGNAQAARDMRQASLMDDQALTRLDLKQAHRLYAALLDEAGADRQAPPAQVGYAHLRLAQLALRDSDVGRCGRHLGVAEQVAVESEDEALYARVLATRGLAAATVGDHQGALRDYGLALAGFEALADELHQAWAHRRLGEVLLLRDEADGARSHLEAALALAQAAGSAAACAATQKILADACVSTGDVEAALAHYDQALFTFVGLRDDVAQAGALRSAAYALLLTERYAEAQAYIDRALDLAQRLDDQQEIAHIHHVRGALYRKRGDPQSAAVSYWHALELYERLGHRFGMAQAQLGLGEIYLSISESARALPALEQALFLFQALGLEQSRAQVQMLVAQAHEALGRGDLAQAGYVAVVDACSAQPANGPRRGTRCRGEGRPMPRRRNGSAGDAGE